MALADNLTTEKAALITILESEYSDLNLRDQLLDRLFLVRSLLDEFVSGGGGVSEIKPEPAATSTINNVASSATSVTLLAANTARKTAIIVNDSTSDLYVCLDNTAASTTNFSELLVGKVGSNLSRISFTGGDYAGEVRGIWASANGFARVTETSQ